MKRINLIIIPEWGGMDTAKRAYYERLYEQLVADKINVGFAPNKGVFLKLLRFVAKQEDSYLFLMGEETSEEDRIFVQEKLAGLGYGPEWSRRLDEIAGGRVEAREQLKEWLKDIKALQSKERR